ncbi:phosphotransferase enzyme family protein [Metarhizium rileyi]|uniref:Phosphotransferase enzyme family protein n=1 Tax=Metarhizium rileyi (strain RCEF 4871) TaxID=1649241 RepID=A0A167C8S3_METRR|nr:phosphotransferase enzyme family protein [Metarhizium rileyi RCEF 4871]
MSVRGWSFFSWFVPLFDGLISWAWRFFALTAGPLEIVLPDDDPANFSLLKPLTPKQRAEQEDAFIQGIDEESICALASRHWNNRACTLQRSDRGSFNICFFMTLDDDDAKVVVRVPIPPAVHEPWERLQSEAFTMQYVSTKTKIPLPQVYAFGQSTIRHGDTTEYPYMILQHVEGQPLDKNLHEKPEPCRRQFYAQLVDILVELQALEFSAAGSLMPRGADPTEADIVGAFSMTMNDLQMYGAPSVRKKFQSVDQFYADQYRMLWNTYLVPAEDLDRKTVQCELFALNEIKERSQLVYQTNETDSFVLSHPDPRHANILVDGNLQIQAIIDWEWSATVPLSYFIPPPRIIQSDLDVFLSVLATRKDHSPGHKHLSDVWCQTDTARFLVVQILQAPLKLRSIYYNELFPKISTASEETAIAEFFKDQEQVSEMERRLHISEQYTAYLARNGIVDEDRRELKELNILAQELLGETW